MEVIIRKDYAAMSREAALIVKKELEKKPRLVLGLATGSTPVGLYKELIRMHKEEKLDFSKVVTFNLDEYVGLSPEHSQSYRYFMQENLFDHINIKPGNTHVPDGMAKNLEKHCEDYEKAIKQAGGIDLQVLGIGSDGHVAFNEPVSSLGSRTRVKTLTEGTVKDNSRFFEKMEDVPRFAITMGVGTILEAKQLLLVANGKNKAEAIAAAVEGPICSQITSSVIQLHPLATVVVDEEASSRLKMADYYRWVDANKSKLANRLS